MRLVIVVILIAQSTSVFGASVPADAAAIAARDIVTLDASAQINTFYVWFHEGPNPTTAGALQYALNAALNKSGVRVSFPIVAGGALMRVDQRLLTPESKDYWPLFRLLENLSLTDPYFHAGEPYNITCPGNHKFWQDNQWWGARRTRDFALHTGMENMLLVHSLTGRFMPIFRADWFANILLSTLKVGNTKGLYYEFVGFKGKNLDGVLSKFGLQAKDLKLANINKQNRSAMLNSGVTHNTRQIFFLFGDASRPSDGPTIVIITWDVKKTEEGNVEKDAFANLEEFKPDGFELIIQANGLHYWLVGAADGTVLDSVPEDIAHDTTVIATEPKSLQSGMSCIACHGPSDGWLPAANQVQLAVRAPLPLGPNDTEPTRIDIFGADKNDPFNTARLQRLAGAYMGDVDAFVRSARDFHAQSTFILTGGLTVPQTFGELQRLRDTYAARVDTTKALSEIGRVVTADENPWQVFANEVPRLPENVLNYSPEHSNFVGLRVPPQLYGENLTSKFDISRAQWETIFPDAMVRKVPTNIQQAP